MKTKLTLNLNKDVIQDAKKYASNHHVSLSKLIQTYLQSLTRETKRKSTISPLVESLTGISSNNYDERKEYRNYINLKHS